MVLLVSLNLNVFASSVQTLNFYNQPYLVLSSNGDITSETVVTEGVYNNNHYTKFHFPLGTTYTKVVTTGFESFLLYNDTTYDFTLITESSYADYNLSVDLCLYDYKDNIIQTYNLISGVFPHNGNALSGEFIVNVHSGSVYIEPLANVNSYAIVIAIGDTNETSGNCTNLFLYDMTFTAVGPLYGKPITPADTDGLTSIMGDYDNTVNQLPSIKDYDTDSLFDFNFDSYTSAMSFVKDMFDNFVALCGLNSVLIFALCIGLATYIVGRKVG